MIAADPMAVMPLLGKELAEQASRKRTYVLRVVCAAALFLVFMLSSPGSGGGAMSMLGSGGDWLVAIFWAESWGILLVLPAAMAGVIVREREQNSLSLLLLTNLRPWEIVIQKYAGGLIPTLTLVLLSAPLLAICYSLGGAPPAYLWAAIYILVLVGMQAGAYALLFSTLCRTAAGALVCTYIAVAALSWLGAGSLAPSGLFQLFSSAKRLAFGAVLAASVPAVGAILAALLITRLALVRLSQPQGASGVGRTFWRLDDVLHRINKRYLRGISFGDDARRLPDEKPIAWRARFAAGVGNPTHIVRLLLLALLPLALFGAVTGAFFGLRGGAVTAAALWVAGLFPFAFLALIGTYAVSGERNRQTLELLLVTPLGRREIVEQKMGAIRYLVPVLGAPCLVAVALTAAYPYWPSHYYSGHYSYGVFGVLGFVAFGLLYALLLATVAWMSLWWSLRIVNPIRSLVVSLLTTACWLWIMTATPWLYGLVVFGGVFAAVTIPVRRRLHASTPMLSRPVVAVLLLLLWIALVAGAVFTVIFVSGYVDHAFGLLFFLLPPFFQWLVYKYFRRACLVSAEKRLGRLRRPAG